MKTLHLVGYKNSGKTTLLERWIVLAKAQGHSVAVLKHHGHGGPIELSPEKTDTMRFFKTGADAALVAGGGSSQLLLNEEPSFAELKHLAAYRQPDILLIEGYKEEQGAKAVLVRSTEDWQSLQNFEGIRLVIGEVTAPRQTVITSRDSTEQLDSWFTEWLNEEDES